MAKQSAPKVVKTSYTSRPVNIPHSFLKDPPPHPISVVHVDFPNGNLPEYEGLYAVVLDGVLTSSECNELLGLCEESVDDSSVPNDRPTDFGSDDRGKAATLWRPAMVNAGPGREVMLQDYRHCDRIIWDDREVVKRIWDRCALAEGVQQQLARIEGTGSAKVQGYWMEEEGSKWKFVRLNERMRFLRYGKGMFFKEHCDGSYVDPETRQRSFYTLHLYLNDSAPQSDSDKSLIGGATTFHSDNMSRSMDVDPKAGRVLIFQHKGLLHSGAEVSSGIKYTMRTDLMYELESKEESIPKEKEKKKKFLSRFGKS